MLKGICFENYFYKFLSLLLEDEFSHTRDLLYMIKNKKHKIKLDRIIQVISIR